MIQSHLCKHCSLTARVVRDMRLWWIECNTCRRTYILPESEYKAPRPKLMDDWKRVETMQ